MPKLPNNPNPAIPTSFLLGNEMMLAMRMLTEPIRQMNEAVENMARPLRQMHEAMESAVIPLQIMQDSLNSSLLPMITAVNAFAEIAKSHQKMIKSLSLFDFDNTIARSARLGIVPKWLRDTQIIDGEITDEDSKLQPPVMQQVVAYTPSQALVPVVPTRPRYESRAKMGLKQISGGNFSYKRTTLGGLSLRNREGKLLGLILENPDLFISDKIMQEQFFTKDIIDKSQIFKLLKNKFKQNGLIATIKRQGDGYILIDIQYLQ